MRESVRRRYPHTRKAMPTAIVSCVACYTKNRAELQRLDLARCSRCGHPLASPEREAAIECPACGAPTPCSVAHPEPRCVHCRMPLRVDLEFCTKCSAYTARELACELWHHTGEARLLLGRVCGPCRSGWQQFTGAPSGVTAGIPFYMAPISRPLTEEEKALEQRHHAGWDRWQADRLHGSAP